MTSLLCPIACSLFDIRRRKHQVINKIGYTYNATIIDIKVEVVVSIVVS